jgi:hypothetical protein
VQDTRKHARMCDGDRPHMTGWNAVVKSPM